MRMLTLAYNNHVIRRGLVFDSCWYKYVNHDFAFELYEIPFFGFNDSIFKN
jgi:hypothetical protein